MEPDEPTPLGASLDALMRSVRAPSTSVVGGIFGRWEDIVGASVSNHVRPIQLDNEVLIVEVDEPGWATQMKFLAPQIITQIEQTVGVTISRIEVRVDPRNARGQRGH